MLYLGRIKAIQLDYTSANRYLLQAIRKAPQSSKTVGFLQAVSLCIYIYILKLYYEVFKYYYYYYYYYIKYYYFY